MLGGESQAVDSVGSTVRPLSKLLRGLCERHVGTDGAVDYCLQDRHTTHLIRIKLPASYQRSIFMYCRISGSDGQTVHHTNKDHR